MHKLRLLQIRCNQAGFAVRAAESSQSHASFKRRLFFTRLAVLLCLSVVEVLAQNEKESPPKPAQSIAELRQQLEGILRDTHTPGMSVAIVHRDGPEWVAGLGKANVAANQSATDETLFRIGSVSKGFVSLSILKLVDEGRLSLQDPVRRLVPEVWFENRWEATDPVRVVDLLEHTTGWDDMHPREYAKDGKGMTLYEALDYDHRSRRSRWPPATREAYCNSGPAVAAYIVEKITGQRFEDYVTQNFFRPIGMKAATYFEQPSSQLTALYEWDDQPPNAYWNLLFRPPGAINASARDMAAYLLFYLNRGAVGGKQIVPAASIDRMESPTRTWAAQEGLKAGFGLSNYTSIHDGFVYHGHGGSLPGSLTDMAYLPDDGVGYFYSINTENGEAFGNVGDAVRAYITRNLTRPAVPPAAPLPPDAQQYIGWYEPDSPPVARNYFLERLALLRIHFEHGNLVFSNIIGTINVFFAPVTGRQFRRLPTAGVPEPIATLVLIPPNDAGRFVVGSVTLKRIPTWFAVVEIALTLSCLLLFGSVVLYAPFWLIGGLMKKRRRPTERAIRLWPLLAVLSLAGAQAINVSAMNDWIARLGNLTLWSFGLCITTLVFAGASLATAVALWRARKKQIRSAVYGFSVAVTLALLVVTTYLAYWGVIGIRTWA